jgi:hypothetical protein
MSYRPLSPRSFQLLSGLSGVVGVMMLGVSFAINQAPPVNATVAELMAYGRANFEHILWGAWLQAVGPVLIVAFAIALVHLAGAIQRLSGWMTLFGATVLMTVSLIEITFYIGALQPTPDVMPYVALSLIASSQHLYFMIAAPALFAPLGFVLVRSSVLPRAFGYFALLLAALFAALGARYMLVLTLPLQVTAIGAVQAVWWLAAAITLMVRRPFPTVVGVH